jgi:hypothetical protein
MKTILNILLRQQFGLSNGASRLGHGSWSRITMLGKQAKLHSTSLTRTNFLFY